MSAAGATAPRKPLGKASYKADKPEIIKQLGVEYWVNVPLEIIEQRIGGREAKWRVYYALIRCSFSLPAQRRTAVRPRLRSGGFEAWVEALKKRISEHRAIMPRELWDETTDTHDSGKEIPLSTKDLLIITGLAKGHLSVALAELRKDGLLGPGEVFCPLAVPAAPFSRIETDPKVTCTGNLLARKLSNQLGIKVTCTGNKPETVQALTEAYTALNEGRKALRTGIINMLKNAGTGHGILIKEERRLKREKHTPSSATPPDSSKTVQPEEGVRKAPVDTKNLGWTRFLEAAKKAGRLPASGQIDFLQRRFSLLSIEEQLAAVAGIDVRLANGEYANPQYVPEMRRYLEEKLWTADLRPRNGTHKRANTVDWSAVIEEDEDA